LQTANNPASEIEIAGEKVFRIRWKKARSRHARYPFELNSTVYKTDLVKKIVAHAAKEHPMLQKWFTRESVPLRLLRCITSMKHFFVSISTFHNPNTLEGHCHQWCKKNRSKIPSYLYFQKTCASAVQINRVNTTTDNPIDGSNEHTVEALNEKYRKGYRFDIEALKAKKPNETHVGRDFFKLVKR